VPQLTAYLFFDGNCAEAMRFYERTLGGKMQMMMSYGESPPGQAMPGADPSRIMHATLIVDGQELMASDGMPGDRSNGKGFSLSLSYPEVAEAHRVFGLLAEGGQVRMPMAKTFWSEAFGMLVDRFGTPWMVSGGDAS
jgi:PhnB protein